MNKVPIPLICISGPTASGKTSLAIKLAEYLGGEIINADSVQVYKDFDIGSAKPNAEELKIVPHHLISHVKPSESYSVGRFRKEAYSKIIEIHKRKKIPIIVGGTGLYIRGLFSPFIDSWGFNYGEEMIKKILLSISKEEAFQFSHRLLEILDKETAAIIPSNDNVRVYRALVQCFSSGLPVSSLKKIRNEIMNNSLSKDSDTDSDNYLLVPLVFILEPRREELYSRINQRVVKMFENGFLEEIQALIKRYQASCPAFRAIGYRHLLNAINLGINIEGLVYDNLIEEIQRDTRRFAKRQITWWRNQPNVLDWKSIFEVCSCSDIFLSNKGSQENSEGESSYLDAGAIDSDKSLILLKQLSERFLDRYCLDSYLIREFNSQDCATTCKFGSQVLYARLMLK